MLDDGENKNPHPGNNKKYSNKKKSETFEFVLIPFSNQKVLFFF